MNNFEKIKKMTIEELAEELRLCANWDRTNKRKAEKSDKDFYLTWLKSDSIQKSTKE